MRSQRFRAVIAAGPGDSAAITMPFDPDEAWGAKANHPVGGTIEGCRIRARLRPSGSGWVLTLAPNGLLGLGVAVGDDVIIELAPEGPQRADLADDIAAALEANPAAAAFFVPGLHRCGVGTDLAHRHGQGLCADSSGEETEILVDTGSVLADAHALEAERRVRGTGAPVAA